MSTPEFPKLDPALAEFWDVRYRANFTPWDAGRIPSQLRDFLARHPASGRVLVPGCGSAHDVRAFAEAGWEVDGIDFSDAAVEAAREVLGPHAARVRQADFFSEDVRGPYALVYERAFLCALPRRLWKDWAVRVASLVPPGGRLAGFFYIEPPSKPGPPYPLADAAELASLLSPSFTRLEDAAVPDSITPFASSERWNVWTR